MKRLIFLILLTQTACGKTAGPSSNASTTPPCQGMAAVGSWQSTTLAKILTLTDQCTGTTDYCNEKFSFVRLDAQGTSILVSVTQTNGGPQCLSLGAHTCTAAMPDTHTLYLNCGVQQDYTR